MSDVPDRGPLSWQVEPREDGCRIDLAVARKLETSRNQAQHWIRDGGVSVDGRPVRRVSRLLASGERVACLPTRVVDPAAALAPEPGELHVLWADDDLAVIDKPPGIAMHPGAGREEGTLAHRLLARFPEIRDVGHPRRPGIVHRLDLGTTGLLVVARNQDAYLGLCRAFEAREVTKTYLAVVYGVPQATPAEIRTRIARDPKDRKRMRVSQSSGRPAVTRYRTLDAAAGLSLLEVDLGTGRTHQIRVHLKSAGHPLVGDPVYGEARWKGLEGRARSAARGFSRPALHARRLRLEHPRSGEELRFVAALPDDLATLWEAAAGHPAGPVLGD